jgi:osmoprotectant transport system substrate-binding protein
MRRGYPRLPRLALVVLAATFGLAACGGSANPLTAGSSAPPAGTVTVGGFNFPESTLLAEVYAQALAAKGVTVTKKLNIGSREVVFDQVKNGGLSVLPEYNGALLAYLDQSSTASTTDDVNAAIKTKLPASLTLLDSSKAEDKDALVVTADTAAKYHLKSIPDLAPVAKNLAVGGPPEFKTRQQGVLGLRSVYSLEFKEFKPLDVAGPITVAALKQGTVATADLFTTDPAIVANGFVVLDDPKNLFGAQNVTPLVNTAALTDTVKTALNALSARLDTATLATLVKKVVADKQDADKVAADWLKTAGLT